MTRRSATRLIFALANAPLNFDVMATLTFRERVTDGRQCLKRFIAATTATGATGIDYAWVREYQERGAVHYHFLLCSAQLWKLGLWEPHTFEWLGAGRAKRLCIRGRLESWLVNAWSNAVGDTSGAFERFQWGGIVEVVRAPNGAASYFGSYLGKEKQKTVPADAEVNGRWWYVSRGAKPVPIREGHLAAYHLEYPLTMIYDKTPLQGAIVTAKQPDTYLRRKLKREL